MSVDFSIENRCYGVCFANLL